MSDLIGQSLGRYHILEQIGEGGMANVYKAFDTRLERDVAVKIIRRQAFPEEQLERILKRFEREAKALARMSHPNIVKVHDYGEYEGSPYLVLEYLPGGTLKDRTGQPMPWEQALQLLTPIVDSLSYAHKHKIIHRDLKPSNILLSETSQPLLTDFGIAKILELEDGQTLTGTGVGVGTPEYMAPEQGMGKDVDSRADVYALGVVLYELLTGRKPYTADTPMAVVFKHMTDPLPRPRIYVPNLPDGVEKLLFKSLAKKPADRYQTMDELGAALQDLLGTRTQSPAPASPGTASTKDSLETRLQEPEEALTTDTLEQPEPSPPKMSLPTSQPAKKLPAWWPRAMAGLVFLVVLIGWFASDDPAQVFPTKTPTSTFTPEPTNAPHATATPVLGVGSNWTRPAEGMSMSFIPAGEFQMGSDDGDGDEQPVHSVYLDAFWMDQTEVTNAMYADCVTAGACGTPGGRYFDAPNYADHPVTYVSWNAAETYCEWAGARLPTEAEWEKAARGGLEGANYPWGDQIPSCAVGAENGAQYYSCGGGTVSVGSFGENGYGLYDMAGNVYEWVADWYDGEYYASSPGNNPSGPSSGNSRVLRGGSWYYNNYALRSAYRYRTDPTYAYLNIGFRCSRSQ